MSEANLGHFAVGQIISGWTNCSNQFAYWPGDMIVVSVADDRSTVELVLAGDTSDIKRSYTYPIKFDDRFGEKVSYANRGVVTVYRADKCYGNAAVNFKWEDAKVITKRENRARGAQRRAATIESKKWAKSLAEKVTVETFRKLYQWENMEGATVKLQKMDHMYCVTLSRIGCGRFSIFFNWKRVQIKDCFGHTLTEDNILN